MLVQMAYKHLISSAETIQNSIYFFDARTDAVRVFKRPSDDLMIHPQQHIVSLGSRAIMSATLRGNMFYIVVYTIQSRFENYALYREHRLWLVFAFCCQYCRHCRGHHGSER